MNKVQYGMNFHYLVTATLRILEIRNGPNILATNFSDCWELDKVSAKMFFDSNRLSPTLYETGSKDCAVLELFLAFFT